MKTRIQKGALVIDINDLLRHISDEDKTELFQHIACDDQVIRDVTAQLLDGWTEAGWHGAKSSEAHADTVNVIVPAINAGRREIAKRSGEVAKAEIEALEKTLKASEARVRELEEERRNAWSKARSVF